MCVNLLRSDLQCVDTELKQHYFIYETYRHEICANCFASYERFADLQKPPTNCLSVSFRAQDENRGSDSSVAVLLRAFHFRDKASGLLVSHTLEAYKEYFWYGFVFLTTLSILFVREDCEQHSVYSVDHPSNHWRSPHAWLRGTGLLSVTRLLATNSFCCTLLVLWWDWAATAPSTRRQTSSNSLPNGLNTILKKWGLISF